MLLHQIRLDLGAMAIKKYSAFTKTPALLEPHHLIVSCLNPGHTFGWGFTPLQKYSQCILQYQPTGQKSVGLDEKCPKSCEMLEKKKRPTSLMNYKEIFSSFGWGKNILTAPSAEE